MDREVIPQLRKGPIDVPCFFQAFTRRSSKLLSFGSS